MTNNAGEMRIPMTPASEILKMIETVSPDDTAKLDEIDVRVSFFIDTERKWSFDRIENGHVYYASEFGGTYLLGDGVYRGLQYTRSRDALKSIRPEGWWFYANDMFSTGEWQFCAVDCRLPATERLSMKIQGMYVPTEELAELHAIIQAIEHERGTAQ